MISSNSLTGNGTDLWTSCWSDVTYRFPKHQPESFCLQEAPAVQTWTRKMEPFIKPEVMDSVEYSTLFMVMASIILIAEFLCGLIFNITVLIISWKALKNTDERGNTFISNLNVVDIVICITAIPMTLMTILTSRFKDALFCFFMEGIISMVCVASSVTLFMISLDRYYAIVTPTKRHVFATKVKLFLVLIWCAAFFGFWTPFFGFNKSKVDNVTTNVSLSCNDVMTRVSPYYFYELFYVLTFSGTTVGMVMFYVAIHRVARHRVAVKSAIVTSAIVTASLSSQEQTRREIAREQERRLLRLSLVIVVAFVCLWGPHVTVTITEMVVTEDIHLEMAQLICQIVAYLTTIAHPLLYAFMRKKVRTAIMAKLNNKDVAIVPSTSSVVKNHSGRDHGDT